MIHIKSLLFDTNNHRNDNKIHINETTLKIKQYSKEVSN